MKLSKLNRKTKPPVIALNKLTSLIADDVTITGDVCFISGIRLDGRVHGNILAEGADAQGGGLLVVSEKGHIEGSVRCVDAVINGTVIGDLYVERYLELQANARVSGTIHYQLLRMDVGATVRGQLLQIDAAPLGANVVALDQAVNA